MITTLAHQLCIMTMSTRTLMVLFRIYLTILTARCYASAVLAMGLCLCLSVCPSVTSRSSTKTAKRRITQTTPHDSPTLVFWCQRSPRNSTGITPTRVPNAGGVVKIGDFRRITGFISMRCVVSIEILPIATQQCRNNLYDKS